MAFAMCCDKCGDTGILATWDDLVAMVKAKMRLCCKIPFTKEEQKRLDDHVEKENSK